MHKRLAHGTVVAESDGPAIQNLQIDELPEIGRFGIVSDDSHKIIGLFGSVKLECLRADQRENAESGRSQLVGPDERQFATQGF